MDSKQNGSGPRDAEAWPGQKKPSESDGPHPKGGTSLLKMFFGVVVSFAAGAAVGALVYYAVEPNTPSSGPPPTEKPTEMPLLPTTEPPRLVEEPRASDLVYLFDRPAEPIFTLRGLYRDVAFDVPESFLPERYKHAAAEVRALAQQNGIRLIKVLDKPMPFDRFADVEEILSFRMGYGRSSPTFLRLAVRFWHFFEESESIAELVSRVVWARLYYNPEMVLDGLMMTMLRSPVDEIKDVQLPELPQYYPELYVDDEMFAKVREQMYVLPENKRLPVPVIRNLPKDDEAALWYFRSDPVFHVGHWKWHVVNPANADDAAYIDQPRRGELFVQVHRQFTARYSAERYSNGLPTVLPIEIHKPLPKAYFPKMTRLHGSKGMAGRQTDSSVGAVPGAIEKHDNSVKLYEQVLQDNFVEYKNGTKVELEGIEGLDIISNLLEGNELLSPNYEGYGSIHNRLHSNVGIITDPLGLHKENNAMTGYITAVANDPVFYNVHRFMDDLYEQYKRKLPPYTKEQMTPLPSVSVDSLIARVSAGGVPDNELRTYWQYTDLDVSRGLDYTPPGRQYARFTHLQHQAFDYVLKVTNAEAKDRRVFVRLFLLMVEDGDGALLDFDFQRRFSIQMDIFDTTLRPGENTVTWSSRNSAVTMNMDAILSEQTNVTEIRRRNYCRCGWSHNLLLPRGSPKGTPYKLFAMVTDYEQDKAPSDAATDICMDGWILCGITGARHYPDRRPMAFPLDRPYRADVNTLTDFLTPNMAVADIVVKFEDRFEGPTALLPGGHSTSWRS